MNDAPKKLRLKSGCRFYYPGKLGRGAEIQLPEGAAHHAIHTLRLILDDPIVLFDGSGGEFLARISHIDRKAVSARTLEFHDSQTESPLSLKLAQGISSGERMDFTIQKAIELGVSGVQPIQATRSVVRLSPERATRKTEHWRKIAVSACEQSGRDRLADVADPLTLTEWLNTMPRHVEHSQLRILLTPASDLTLANLAEGPSDIALLVGPEGGFSPEEISVAMRWQFRPVKLGPRVLRTETAALAALAAIQLRWGDFQ